MSDILCRDDFNYFCDISTRWLDNDVYGHINNVQYYAYFDTTMNRFLIDEGKLDIHNDQVVAYVVESLCRYHSSLAYPDALEVGLRVAKLGRRSVTYQLAIFKRGEDKASATGHVVHVFVDRELNKSTEIPASLREALQSIEVVSEQD